MLRCWMRCANISPAGPCQRSTRPSKSSAAAEQPVAPELRARIVELADKLFSTIQLQSSVPRHRAIAVDRGATLDTVDFPVGDSRYFHAQFAEIRALDDEAARLGRLDEIINWTNPGPGGFYDDLGNPSAQPHLVRGLPFNEDPASFESPRIGFEEAPDVDLSQAPPFRVSWINHAESLYDAPLRMRYTNLDPSARYKLRVVYAGDMPEMKIRLVANRRDRNPSLHHQAEPGRAHRVRHPGVSNTRRRIEFGLVPRTGPRPQRPRLPGLRGLADPRTLMNDVLTNVGPAAKTLCMLVAPRTGYKGGARLKSFISL